MKNYIYIPFSETIVKIALTNLSLITITLAVAFSVSIVFFIMKPSENENDNLYNFEDYDIPMNAESEPGQPRILQDQEPTEQTASDSSPKKFINQIGQTIVTWLPSNRQLPKMPTLQTHRYCASLEWPDKNSIEQLKLRYNVESKEGLRLISLIADPSELAKN